jgi:hypothetical protein
MEQNKAAAIHASIHLSSTYLLHILRSSNSSVNVSFYVRHYEASSLIVRLEQLQLLQKNTGQNLTFWMRTPTFWMKKNHHQSAVE